MPCSGEAKTLTDAQALRFFKHRMAQGNVGKRKSAMPEQVGLGVVLPPRLETGDDLTKFRVQRLLRQLSGLDMGAQAAELAALALAPVVDNQFCHDVGERQL